MNIWYICKYASPEKYFFGTRHFYLSEEWVKMGHEVSIITSNASHMSDNLPKFKGKMFFEVINGVKTFWLNTYRSKTSTGISRFLSWLHFEWQVLTMPKQKAGRPDVVIASSLSLFTVISAWIYARQHKARLIFEVRDIWPLSAILLGNYSPKHPIIRLLAMIEKFGYRKADAIVGTIPNLQQHVRNVSSSSAPVYCIPQGLSLSFYEKQESIPPGYFNAIPPNAFVVCYAGTISINNPLSTLVEAARLLKNERDIYFVIVGDGSNKPNLQEEAKGLPNVLFLPPLKKSQINDLLVKVHVCYDSFESFLAAYGLSRNKWIDYMYAGKPLVCSYDGFQSMVNEAGNGAFVKYGDSRALADKLYEYYLTPRTELAEIGLKGKEFLLTHRTFDRLAKEYLAIFTL
ncbi:hypothetical protein DLD77_05500 [Chitinophaga alhagiae]|uniref:Glycosyltransferase subfamily 4-like N-terminal domain-containing protein n=1 Tax=Chitinophaga alhagiae TaxID=2203219 RepID=A0ABN5LPL8_9BACT|nr:glycosyltransferase family 4 protein [Chitinophaga alhagiae]AWO01184.1 hypothetical protein DLD77_05500 [Chitinophaga alhagiae]